MLRLARKAQRMRTITQRQTPLILAATADEPTREGIEQALRSAGFGVLIAADGETSVALFAEHQPDLVLLDVHLPKQDSYRSACERIRAHDSSYYVPVLVLADRDDVCAVVHAFDCGATDFITKPINWTLFTQRVRYALRGSELATRLKDNQDTLESAHRIAKTGYFEWDIAAQRLLCSTYLAQLLSLDLAQFDDSLGALQACIHPEHRAAFANLLHAVAHTGQPASLDLCIVLPGGEARYVYSRAEATFDLQGIPIRVLGIIHDVSAHKAVEQQLAYLHHHDTLTGLANRTLFHDRLRQTMYDAERRKTKAAILFLDLDRFRDINESLGHEAGDALLKTVAERLLPIMRKTDILSRFLGDEFGIIAGHLRNSQDASRLAQRLLKALQSPFTIADQNIFVSASLGIAIYPTDGKDAESLIRNAESAMRQAKNTSRHSFQFYQAEMNRSARERLAMESRLHVALERNEFLLHFQPQINILQGGLHGAEALLRWNDGNNGIVPPGQFIPMLEENGLMVEVGEWVLREACRWARGWHAEGLRLRISVNLSPRQFAEPNLVDRVLAILQETGLAPEYLELELTESTLMVNEKQGSTILAALNNAGISLAIDDFGTGYSSLAYLKRLPVDYLKVDKSFVTHMDQDSEDRVIVRSTVDLAHNLGLRVVAEGIENGASLHLLKEMHCDMAQGFFIARPMTSAQFAIWLRNYLADEVGPDSGETR